MNETNPNPRIERREYANYIKPSWAPPSWLFGPVWSVLYILIAISFGTVFISFWQGLIGYMLALPFLLNVIANVAFTPIQFGLKNNLLASIDIVLVLFTLVWAMYAIFPFAPWITYIQIPYVLWGSYATALQLTITWLNRDSK